VQGDRHEQVERDLTLIPADQPTGLAVDLAGRKFRLEGDALGSEQTGEVLGGDRLRERAVERRDVEQSGPVRPSVSSGSNEAPVATTSTS
jgi:hypothetical protein